MTDEPPRLNVGQNRSAREALDAMVMREALETLKTAVEWRDKLADDPASQEAWEALVDEDGCLDNEARAAITKLEARLLRE